MVRSKIAFLQSADENLLASLQIMGGLPGVSGRPFTITEFTDENELIRSIVLARLDDDTTVELISKILLAVTGSIPDRPWVSLSAETPAFESFCLRMPEATQPVAPPSRTSDALAGIDLHKALEQTPVPLALMEGPEHTYVFANDAYVHVAGRISANQLVGKKIRDAFSESEGEAFFGLLDRTYRTGEIFVGREVLVKLYSHSTQQVRDHYFDFVYHPVRDADGEVCGIFSQANDVTERVLDKHVREAREEQLYQQWAELDSLYRTSPLSMMLLRASDMKIQRLNERAAKHLGGRTQDLVGRSILEFFPNESYVGDMFRRVVDEKKERTLELTMAVPSAPDNLRRWAWNLSPILNAAGGVESIASTGLEVSDVPNGTNRFPDRAE